ncbi:hypothetical protein PGB34_20475 [Xenophilus arseniciresistens]|uniref:Uncharacterized protein n=1 Tax=Xenophilus arseniciresistens TaxID=1283306 RepID=A0AAE3NBR7_9BURK|nr:hypothetical protein [Xenophilus arseniciresistens]MDA7418756.1 hypothetical protein [Xenophilus arseniciresistens]
MQSALSPDDSAELVRLWQHRQALAPSQMGRLYTIVGGALGGCHPPELQALGESRQELVAQFIYIKVLRLDVDPDDGEDGEPAPKTRGSHSAPSTAFALCAYFRRYLIDCTRASSFRRKLSIGDEVNDAQLEAQLGEHEDEDACLREHGLSAARVAAAARAFIAALDEPERLLLCEGFGQEAPLSGVAARHAIASYHYRAGRLGLVHKREALPADYGKTAIGRWLQEELGIALVPDNVDAILAVFKILGAEAS